MFSGDQYVATSKMMTVRRTSLPASQSGVRNSSILISVSKSYLAFASLSFCFSQENMWNEMRLLMYAVDR